MEDKVKVWLARHKNGKLFVFSDIPKRIINYWGTASFDNLELDCTKFPSVKWEDDEPTEAYITLAEPQEQRKQEPQPKTKQAIDWEQRRYEIAKAIMPVLYRHCTEALKYGLRFQKEIVDGAVLFADMLIEKLKEKSE